MIGSMPHVRCKPSVGGLKMREIKVPRVDDFHARGRFQLQATEPVEPCEHTATLTRGKTKIHLGAEPRRAREPAAADRSERIVEVEGVSRLQGREPGRESI